MFLPRASTPVLDSKEQKMLSQGLTITNVIFENSLFISSTTSSSGNFNFLILLLIVNNLYQYSFLREPPVSGLTSIVHDLNKLDNFTSNKNYPLGTRLGIHFSVRYKESNIKVLRLVSPLLFYSVLVIVLFLTFIYINSNKEEEQIKELAPLFLRRRMDRVFMKKFFKVYKKKLGLEKMHQINDYFRRTKRKIKSSKFTKFFRRWLRKLYKKKFHLVFSFFQIYSIQLSHLAAKSAKILVRAEASLTMMSLSMAYHLLIAFFFSISFFALEKYGSLLDFFILNRDDVKIEEYFVFKLNLPSICFNILYVYVSVFFGSEMTSEVLVLFILCLFVLTYSVECLLNAEFRSYCLARMVINFPLVFIPFAVLIEDKDFYVLASDCLLCYLNFSTIIFIGYELACKPIQKKIDKLIRRD